MNLDNFNPELLAKSPVLASMAGAVVGLKFAPGDSWAARAINGFGGFATAIFGTQLLAWFLKLENVGAIAGLSFVVGILSMVVFDAVVKGLAETRVGEFFNGVLQRLLAVIGVKREG